MKFVSVAISQSLASCFPSNVEPVVNAEDVIVFQNPVVPLVGEVIVGFFIGDTLATSV